MSTPAHKLRYERSEKGLARKKRYKQSEKGKATQKRYRNSAKGKAAEKRYEQSAAGLERNRGSNERRVYAGSIYLGMGGFTKQEREELLRHGTPE